MLGVVPFAGALLVAVNRFDSGVDVDPDPAILQTAQLPDPLAQDAGNFQNRPGLIDPQAVHVAPEDTGYRKPADLEKASEHRVQANVYDWPNRCYDRIPDGILFFNPYVVQDTGINTRP